VPGLICVVTGLAYVWLVPDEERHASKRSSTPDVALSAPMAITILTLFMVVALTAGLVFNTLSVALPKIVDERTGGDIPLVVVGGLATAVFLCGGLAQIAVGRLVERFPPHLLFVAISVVQFAGVAWAVNATGVTLLAALALTMAAIYGQITVNDLVIARYTADAWRGRVYAVRYFFTFMVSGLAIPMIAYLYGSGGFALVLGATAVVAFAMLVAVVVIAVIANGVEKARVPQPVPAE
jgi:MFS family permease